MMAGAALAVLQFFHIGFRVPLDAESAYLPGHFRTRRRSEMLQGIVSIILFVGLGVVRVSIVNGKGQFCPMRWRLGSRFPGLLGCYIIRTTLYWEVILALARSGQLTATTPLSRLVGLPWS